MHQEEVFKAYVLVKVESGQDLRVFNKIQDLKTRYRITEVATVYGDYDIITGIEINKAEELEDFVFTGLRRIGGIKETKTLITARYLELGKKI